MNKFITTSTSTALLLGAFLITGCTAEDVNGTSGITYDGNTSPAAIDATNVEVIGTSAGEAVQKADASTGLPGAITITTSTDMDQINSIVLATANISGLPAGIDISSQICTSGSASTTLPTALSGPSDVVTTYRNCLVIGSDIIIDGKATVHYNDFSVLLNAGFSITYTNFTVTDPVNGTTTINLTMVCDNAGCTFNSDFVGTDGVTHRVSSFTISGDASAGFYGSATFFHGTYGEVTITITGITYGGSCEDTPNGGSVSFDSTDGSSGTITFSSDCTTSGTWTNTSSSGSF